MNLDANLVDVHRAVDAVLTQLDQRTARNAQRLFIATSNFPGAIDGAFLSHADLVVTVDLPTLEACRAILLDTLMRIARLFPNAAKLDTDALTERQRWITHRRRYAAGDLFLGLYRSSRAHGDASQSALDDDMGLVSPSEVMRAVMAPRSQQAESMGASAPLPQ